MNYYLALLLLISGISSAQAADVGVSVNIGEPGFYGQIDIGNYPPPQVVYTQPRIIRPVIGVQEQPLYLRVPPGHRKHWDKFCGRYGACGQPVYFVQEDWYNRVYVPQYRERYHNEEHDRDYDRDHDNHGRDDHDQGHHNEGHGHGHDRH